MPVDHRGSPRARKGCIALFAAPALVVLASAAALHQARAQRRRGSAIRVRLARRTIGNFATVTWEIDVPHRRLGEVVRAIAGCASHVAAQVGLRVGCVGLSPDEEPALVALAPRRDLIADAFTQRLLEGDAHARRQLWLSLPPGVYLAEAIDPYAPCAGDEEQVVGLLARHVAQHAVLFGARHQTDSVLITVSVYAPRPELRELVALARASFEGGTGWERQR